jgi:hypothetical protein
MVESDECTFQQEKNDTNESMNPMEEECDQSDLRLENYVQNSHQRLS